VSETLSRIAASESQPDQPSSSGLTRGRRHRLVVRLALGVGLVGAAGIGTWLWTRNASTDPPPAETGPVATAEVTRGTLTATETWDGTLGYGSPFTVTAQGSGSGSGEEAESASPSTTVTRLVDQGATVGRGDELYRVNEEPVILLLGRIPMYRDLAPGASGPDVRQLEANLANLGYGGFTPDAVYTSSTAEAVRDWQSDLGAQVSGVVSRGSVVFLPQRGRVDGLRVDVGDPVSPGTEILDITGTEQVASLEVDVDDRDLVEVDTEVTVAFPGGTEVAGTVTSVNVVEAEPSPAEGAAPAPADPVTEVEVTLAESVSQQFLGAPVDVILGVEERSDVLSVPVTALLALAEGGYGLEVVRNDGPTEIVPVDTGLFASGRVEVSGPGITEGTVVGVAGR
jgi:peptidoglycan hydrolase-like protein with peptidoglycan-binding domain